MPRMTLEKYIKELSDEAIPPERNIKQEVVVPVVNTTDTTETESITSTTSQLEEKDIEEVEEGDEPEVQIHSSSSLKITKKVKVPSNKKQCKGCNKIVTTKTLNLYDGDHCKKCFDKL